jgi:pyruvate dehydrogenase E2 component (dihydrolipoamide acetyltransferase)
MAEATGKPVPAQGTGIGGRVTSHDVLTPGISADGGTEVRKLSNMRRIIAAKMQESLQNSAQLTHHTSADARRLLELRRRAKDLFEKGAPENITINDLVCFAVIRALKKHPLANCHLNGDSITLFKNVHLGLAVDTERGLMVPTVRNADHLSIQGLAAQLKSVANACKKGNFSPELLASESATFSVSNLGSYGVEIFTPVINLPQVAILGVNTIINRPADLGNGVFGFIPFIGLSLTYDHRALDGAPASALLRDIRLEIENLEVNL